MAIQFIPDGDPMVDDVRRARFEISEMCGHDPNRLVDYYMQRQEQHRDRLVSYGVPSTPKAKGNAVTGVGTIEKETDSCDSEPTSAVAEQP
jgi:hypothetical protein